MSCGGGGQESAAAPTAAAGAPPAADAPAAAPEVPDPVFAEPASLAQYLAGMGLGTQPSDYLENLSEAGGAPYAVALQDFDTMRYEGNFGHVRIPANCAARADVNGLIAESFLQKLDAEITAALRRLDRVVLDPLHGYLQWKGDHSNDIYFDDYQNVATLTTDQLTARATAIWLQLATRYRDVSPRLSFDLVNEPAQTTQTGYAPGLSSDQLNAWYAAVIPAIRATGGNNASRVMWLQPWNNELARLAIPGDAGPLGVSPHYYTPYNFTHGADALNAAGLANFSEDIRWARQWAADQSVPLWIGEAGVSVNIARGSVPRTPQDRAEYNAHLRAVALAADLPLCYWGYNSNFALYDQAARSWLPLMQQAVTGLPTPYPVRDLPAFIRLTGGRIALPRVVGSNWSGFSYDPVTGILSAAANPGTTDRYLVLVFPEIAVASQQSWISRATAFEGDWAVGTCPMYFDTTQSNNQGVAGLDLRAVNDSGLGIYPGYRAPAPGGFDNAYGTIASPDPYFGIDVKLLAGSRAGSISFSCLRSV
ncbi:cellulase family glycosylhydrolase [Xylophilus rhododendri]|uniref:Cellulase family glycosylhydrolase n=1 Tax=Xylophilus rhododendri TaxID=2697032 RepID=A0A857J766_9BURK|nr:cellulase family glycosylhydrolase [Xylophilus rhododendri]QHI99547.1 cellulase family glycosylhydrolase [Xylophilus rhododendri]